MDGDPNGVDPSVFRPDPAARRAVREEVGLPQDAPVVALIARRDAMKDHETFLRAAAVLADKRPDVWFLLAGEGVSRDSAEWRTLSDAAAGGARLIALGRRSDVPRLLAAADLSTCSSISEGFPNVIIESMACGIPCVVTNVGDAAQIVGSTGIAVPASARRRWPGGWMELLALEEGSGLRAAHARGSA